MRRTIAWSGLFVLLFFHFDFWRDRAGPGYVAGVPSELAYRLVWIAAAICYLRWFHSTFFREDDSGVAR
jgi:uncharacterized membrane protein